MNIEPIAHIHTNYDEKFGIPRQSGLSHGKGRIVFVPKYRDPESLRGIEGYSHLWLIFDFSESHMEEWSPTVRPPRLGGNVRMGVFATRSPFRPNSLGLSSVRLLGLEDSDEGTVLIVEGADLLDGTPIYDIKPYVRYSDSHEDAVSGFADDVCGKRLDVTIDNELRDHLTDDSIKELEECIAQDPRPGYHEDGREYTMLFSGHDITFVVNGKEARIIRIRER